MLWRLGKLWNMNFNAQRSICFTCTNFAAISDLIQAEVFLMKLKHSLHDSFYLQHRNKLPRFHLTINNQCKSLPSTAWHSTSFHYPCHLTHNILWVYVEITCFHAVIIKSRIFVLWRNVCIICSLRAIFYRLCKKREEQATDCYIYDKNPRVSFIRSERMEAEKRREELFSVKHLCFIQFHPLTSNNACSLPIIIRQESDLKCRDETMPWNRKTNSQQRHAGNKASAKYLYDYYGNLLEEAAALTFFPISPSMLNHMWFRAVQGNVKLCNNHQRQSRTIKR